MINKMQEVWLCAFGPRLRKVYRGEAPTALYTPGYSEKWGDKFIFYVNIMWKIGIYTSPLIASYYYYRKDFTVANSAVSLIKMMTGLGFVLVTSFCLRSYGRVSNVKYRQFINVLNDVNNGSQNKSLLRNYDFDFDAWPIDFDATKIPRPSNEPEYIYPRKKQMRYWSDYLVKVMGEVAVRTFGIKLIYPGSTTIMNMLIDQMLLEGRIKLVLQYEGIRYKVRTKDGNDIDCMYIDGHPSMRKTLVIAAEGNAGFYENGIMTTPIGLGYSVLGWNHPGFGGSTGQPYPLQEQYAIDAVIQMAIHKLKYTPENIILFGWSIGCYSVAWAATQYPNVKGVIIDATFDDLLPLALSRMPPSWEPLVTEVIRSHVDLNIAEILKRYSGPIKFIRRMSDEIMCTVEGKLSTHRGNNLMVKFLAHRYPELFDDEQYNLLYHYLSLDNWEQSPLNLAELPGDRVKNEKLLSLVRLYLSDVQSTHCTPLPDENFYGFT